MQYIQLQNYNTLSETIGCDDAWKTEADIRKACENTPNCIAYTMDVSQNPPKPLCLKYGLYSTSAEANVKNVHVLNTDVSRFNNYMYTQTGITYTKLNNIELAQYSAWTARSSAAAPPTRMCRYLPPGVKYTTVNELKLACDKDPKCQGYTVIQGQPGCLLETTCGRRFKITENHDTYLKNDGQPCGPKPRAKN